MSALAFEVSDPVRYVFVPLASATVAAIGIVVSLAFVTRNEQRKARVQHEMDIAKAESDRTARLERNARATMRDALGLYEFYKYLSLERKMSGSGYKINEGQRTTLKAARERLFGNLYGNAELFEMLTSNQLRSEDRVDKLMLLLSVAECRLRNDEENWDGGGFDPIIAFALSLIIQEVGKGALAKEHGEVLRQIADNDREAKVFFTTFYPGK